MHSQAYRNVFRGSTATGLAALCSLILGVSAVFGGPLDFAHGLYRQKRFSLAAEEYASYLEKTPDGPEAVEAKFFLAECYVQLDKVGDALPLLRSVLKAVDEKPGLLSSSQEAIAAYRIGESEFHRRAYADAVPFLRRVLERHPESDLRGHAAYLLAESQMELGDLDAAQKAILLARPWKLDADVSGHLQLSEAKLLERLGQADEARVLLRAAAAEESSGLASDAQFALGLLEQRQKQPAAAATAFQAMLDRFPNSPLRPAAQLHLATSLEQIGRGEESIGIYESVLQSNASPALLAESYYRLGLAKYERKDYAEARRILGEGLARFPESPLAVAMSFQEAASVYKLGDLATAMTLLEAFATRHAKDPLAPQAIYLMTRCAVEQKDLAAAKAAISRLSSDYADSTWADAARTSYAEAVLQSTDLSAEAKVQQVKEILANTREADAKRRLHYYAALASFQAGDMGETIRLLEPVSGSEANDAIGQDSEYLLGIALTREEKYADAIAPLLSYASRDATTPQARTAIVQLLLSTASLTASPDKEATLVRGMDLAAKRPDGAQVLIDAANAVYAKGSYESAAIIYGRAAEIEVGKAPAAILGRAWSEFELGKSDPARREAALGYFREAAAASDPASDLYAEALYMEGVVSAELGQATEAIEALRKAFASKSKFGVDAGRRLAQLLTQNGKEDEAEKVYASLAERVGDGEPRLAVLAERAWLALDRQDIELAESLFREIVQSRSKRSAESAVKLAEIAHAKGDLSASVDWTRQAEALNPPDELVAGIHYRRGLSLAQLGKGEEAREALDVVVDRYPEDPLVPGSLFWLGELEFATRRFDEAIARYRELLGHPKNEKYAGLAQLRIAQSLFQRDALDASMREVDALLAATEETATRDEATYLKGRILQQQAKFDEAREVYRTIIRDERTESAAKAQFMIGETLFFQERYEEALKALLKVQILYPIPTWQAAALVEIGKLQEKQGNLTEARQSYETVLAEYADEPAAREAKQRLADLKAEGSPSDGEE